VLALIAAWMISVCISAADWTASGTAMLMGRIYQLVIEGNPAASPICMIYFFVLAGITSYVALFIRSILISSLEDNDRVWLRAH
jgi:hypothetical protein